MSQENTKIASPRIKAVARITDVFFILILFTVTLKLTVISPTPRMTLLLIICLIGSAYWIPQKVFTGASLGERLWKLKPKQKTRYKLGEPLFHKVKISNIHVFIGSLSATFSALVALTCLNDTILKHPIWTPVTRWNLSPLFPPPAGTMTTPIFYTTGGWPIEFNGKPVSFSLEYKKGPPHHFISHITSHWADPDISLVIEGPKTPKDAGIQEKLKKCFTNRFSYSCLISRELTLSRHLEEIRTSLNDRWPEKWTVKWFNVENPAVPPEEQAQGIYLSALSGNKIQDRFILINLDGIQQTLILNRSDTPIGQLAFDKTVRILRGIRTYNELNTARNWINQLLENTQLKSLSKSIPMTELANKLTKVQLLLISRISVYPQNIDSYFHLAGTSTMILNRVKNPSSTLTDVAMKNIESSYRYTSDISPNDPRVQQILSLWQEHQKKTQPTSSRH